MMPAVVTLKGGPGSGHRGHSGRPGKVGGSVSGSSHGNTELEQVLRDFAEMVSKGGLGKELLKHGEFFTPPTSDKLPSGIRRGKMKECYYNCATYADDDKGWYYTEGYAVSDSLRIPIEHAWITTKDGQVIDPTWKADSGGMAYYGIRMKTNFVWDTMERTKYYGVFSNDFLDNHRIHDHGLPDSALVNK